MYQSSFVPSFQQQPPSYQPAQSLWVRPTVAPLTPNQIPQNPQNPAQESQHVQTTAPVLTTKVQVTSKQVEQRQKQVNFGLITPGYWNFKANCLTDASSTEISSLCELPRPITPDIHMACTKKPWGRHYSEWRRDLHKWDNVPCPTGYETHPDWINVFLPEIKQALKEIQRLNQGKMAQNSSNDDQHQESLEDICFDASKLEKYLSSDTDKPMSYLDPNTFFSTERQIQSTQLEKQDSSQRINGIRI